MIKHMQYIFFAITAFAFYHFVAFPLFLDYGIYGVGLTACLLAIGLFLLPAKKRLHWAVLLIGYLLLVRGLYHVEYKGIWQQIIAWIVLTLVLIAVEKLLVRKTQLAHLVVLSLVGGLLFSQFGQEELFFARKFQVLYESPQLYTDTNVDYYSLSLADTTGTGQMDIITRGFTEDDLLNPEIVENMTMPGRAPLQLEASRYLVYHFNPSNKAFEEIGQQPSVQQPLSKQLARDYVGFPYYGTQWIAGDNFINSYTDVRNALLKRGFLQMDFFYRLEDDLNVNFVDNLGVNPSYFNLINQALQEKELPVYGSVDTVDNIVDNSVGIYELLVPKVDRVHLIQSMLPFGRTAFSALSVSAENIHEQVASWNQMKTSFSTNNSTASVEELAKRNTAGSSNENTEGSMEKNTQGNTAESAGGNAESTRVEASLNSLISDISDAGAFIIGTAQMTNDSPYPELVVYHDGLAVYQWQGDSVNPGEDDDWQIVARLTPDTLRVLADGEFLLADITGDGLAEILLSGKPSQILQLAPATNTTYPYAWKQLWVARDDVFRFEAVTDDGLILALSQSYKRNENRRFLTGYKFITTDATDTYALEPVWRTNNTVINVRSGDINGDGTNELVATYFREHRFIVLKEHGLPVQEAAWLLTGISLLIALGYRYRMINSERKSLTRNPVWKSSLPIGGLIVLVAVASLIGIVNDSHISSNGSATLLTEKQPSNAQSCEQQSDEPSPNFVADWNRYWTDAVTYSNENGKSFWYSGWIVTKVQKRQTTSMYDGIVVQDDGILVNARMLGQPFKYYESNGVAYLSEENRWKRLLYEGGYPADWLGRYDAHADTLGSRMNYRNPFGDLHILADIPEEAIISAPQIVGEEAILGKLSDKISLTIDTRKLNIGSSRGLNIDDTNAIMEWTIWVGQEEPYIYQYNVETLMPVPNAGMMQQTTYFRFWNYNDPAIALTKPQSIEKQIVTRELRQIADIEHALQTEKSREQLTDMEIRLLVLRLTILRNNVNNSIIDTDGL